MNDKGEMTCPICTEEMDMTDRQLKPCKCGYQICLWCFHQIIEIAEKDKTEGRCPACRTPYDKERICEMTVSCQRLVAELNNGRRKLQKGKPKPSEGRKELTGVRVIQRNLVYVKCLPLELADENLFQRREYFGQYGKVIKVAMSRTPAGAVQQFPNNTCSVYITYSKAEEAIRCIRSVHGFTLDGRYLRACFGTMKYCHAWLRNTPCTNADCLYLHEIGSQEDSFTKDETIADHMRNLVEEITGVVGNYQRRSGSKLPPPVDDYVDNESITRRVPKCVLNNAHSVVKSSLPNDSNGRSVTLPAGALWGMQPSRQSLDATNSAQISTPPSDLLKKQASEDNQTSNGNVMKPPEPLDGQTDFPELSLYNRTQNSDSREALVSASVDNSRAVSETSDCTDFPEHDASQSCETMLSDGNKKINGRVQSVSAVSAGGADSIVETRSESSHINHASIKPSHTEVSRDSLEHCVIETREVQPLQKCCRTNGNEVNGGTSLMPSLATDGYPVADDDISLFNRQRLKDPEVVSSHPNVANKTGFLHMSNLMQPCTSQYKSDHVETRAVFGSSTSDGRGSNLPPPISHGYIDMPFSEPSLLNNSRNHSMVFPDKASPIGNSRSEMDERIIENIMSLDLDEYLTSPHNLSKLFGGADDIEARSRKLASADEVKNNQSRFPFARQDESNGHASESCNAFNKVSPGGDFYQNSSQQQSPVMDILGVYTNGSSSSYLNSTFPASYKPPAIPRCPVSAPPGFSVSSRPPPPPPGFALNGREQQTFNGFSGNHNQAMFGNSYQSLPIGNTGGVRGVQFSDPAILSVGQCYENASLDFRSNFQGNTNFFGNEANLQQQQQQQHQMVMQSPLSLQHQQMMQSPLSLHQNCRSTDSLGMASRLIDQSQGSSNVLSGSMALPNNGLWDGLNSEIQSLNRLQNERFVGSTNRMNGYNGTFRS